MCGERSRVTMLCLRKPCEVALEMGADRCELTDGNLRGSHGEAGDLGSSQKVCRFEGSRLLGQL